VERRCRLALASELVGLARRIIDVSAEKVRTQRRLGRPVGADEAVRSQLTQAYAEMAGARAMVTAAWEDGSPASALWAKVTAARAHDTAAKQALRVCGAVGLHTEHPLPRLVRRGISLDALLGQASAQYASLGRGLLGDQLAGVADRFVAVGCF
jgi:alkylation response protein AidB-like acyl-CoA dehydrogenase